jgi:hypothetical protein
MTLLAQLAALLAILSIGVGYGTDVFCALVQRPALARATQLTDAKEPVDLDQVGTYHQHRVPPSTKRRPSHPAKDVGRAAAFLRRRHAFVANEKGQPAGLPSTSSSPSMTRTTYTSSATVSFNTYSALRMQGWRDASGPHAAPLRQRVGTVWRCIGQPYACSMQLHRAALPHALCRCSTQRFRPVAGRGFSTSTSRVGGAVRGAPRWKRSATAFTPASLSDHRTRSLPAAR